MRGLLWSSRFPTTNASATVYWLVRWSISGMVTGGLSISDKKNPDFCGEWARLGNEENDRLNHSGQGLDLLCEAKKCFQ
ncbi:hypothetical protein GW17_00047552 [Ensete ventricosum]|nr:hypothetical protein GW17_00047552 [Ensete ventricosum]